MILAILLSLHPQSDDPFEEGRKAFARKQYAKAERHFKAHVKAKPDDAHGWFFLGLSHAAQREFKTALPAYEEAFRLGT